MIFPYNEIELKYLALMWFHPIMRKLREMRFMYHTDKTDKRIFAIHELVSVEAQLEPYAPIQYRIVPIRKYFDPVKMYEIHLGWYREQNILCVGPARRVPILDNIMDTGYITEQNRER